MLIFFITLLFLFLFVSFIKQKCCCLRWENTKEIKVYIPYEHYLCEMMKKAFKEWSKASDYNINFEFINNKKICDIEVVFQDKFQNANWYDEKVGYCEYEYLGKYLKKATIYVVLKDCIIEKRLSETELYSTMLHEIGHSIGLKHINSKTSIMNARMNEDTPITFITDNDIVSLKQLYNLG